jgi:hypothetical protein
VTVLGSICGKKFHDANANGVDDNEPGIPGWKIVVTDTSGAQPPVTVFTDDSGHYCVNVPVGTYAVAEVSPGGSWVNTAPTSTQVSVTPEQCRSVVDFGNVCAKAPANGFTLGYWSNPNGKSVLSANDSGWRDLLNGCNLRNANGTMYTVPGGSFSTAYGNFRTWVFNAKAVNMANMLSAQLAATTLNVQYMGLSDETGLVVPACLTTSSGANVVTTLGLPIITGPLGLPDCSGNACASGNGYISIGSLRALAKASLATNGKTAAGHTARAYQECLKDLLDQVNNNGGLGNCPLLWVISPAPCPFTSPY